MKAQEENDHYLQEAEVIEKGENRDHRSSKELIQSTGLEKEEIIKDEFQV